MVSLAIRWRKVLLTFASLAVSFTAVTSLQADVPGAANPLPGVTVEEENSPEAAFRKFLNAMCSNDLETVKSLVQPSPEFEKLLETREKPPAEVAEQLKASLQVLPINRLKVGDQYVLPNGKKGKVDAKMITDDRTLLSFQGVPFPIPMVKGEDGWKIDPKNFVDSAKAAQKSKGRKQPY